VVENNFANESSALDAVNIDKNEELMPPAPQPTQITNNNTHNISLLLSEKDGRSLSDESLILNAEPIISNNSTRDEVVDGKALIDQAIKKALQDRFDRIEDQNLKLNAKKDIADVIQEPKGINTPAPAVSLGPEFAKLAAQVDDIEKNVKRLVYSVEVFIWIIS
jgi:hypothetical protein